MLLDPVGKFLVSFASLRSGQVAILCLELSKLSDSLIPHRIMRLPNKTVSFKAPDAFLVDGAGFPILHAFILVALPFYPARQAWTFVKLMRYIAVTISLPILKKLVKGFVPKLVLVVAKGLMPNLGILLKEQLVLEGGRSQITKF